METMADRERADRLRSGDVHILPFTSLRTGQAASLPALALKRFSACDIAGQTLTAEMADLQIAEHERDRRRTDREGQPVTVADRIPSDDAIKCGADDECGEPEDIV